MENQTRDEQSKRSLRLIYRRSVIASFGGGVINPFINIFAAQMGASSVEMGWVRALEQISTNAAQIPWGLAIDRFRRRVPFIFTGALAHAVLLLPLLYVNTVQEFVLVVTLIFIFSAMISPALTSLISDFCGETERGRVFAQLNAMASLGGIPATMISGYILYKVGGPVSEMYRIPLILGFLFGVAVAIIALKIKEGPVGGGAFTVMGWLEALRVNRYFKRFCLVSSVQGFFMAMAWPIFTLTTVRVVKADMFQISLLSVVASLTAVVVRRFTGRLADRAGRKPLLIMGRSGIFLVPLVYAFATSIHELIVVELVIGTMMASSSVALSAYLLDVSPRGLRGSYMGLYNALYGGFTFIGSIVGGYLMDFVFSLGLSFQESMRVVYMVSALGRGIGGALYITLQEPYKYPARFGEELKRMLKEDAERIEKEMKAVDELAEKFRRTEDEDLEWFEKMSGGKS